MYIVAFSGVFVSIAFFSVTDNYIIRKAKQISRPPHQYVHDHQICRLNFDQVFHQGQVAFERNHHCINAFPLLKLAEYWTTSLRNTQTNIFMCTFTNCDAHIHITRKYINQASNRPMHYSAYQMIRSHNLLLREARRRGYIVGTCRTRRPLMRCLATISTMTSAFRIRIRRHSLG